MGWVVRSGEDRCLVYLVAGETTTLGWIGGPGSSGTVHDGVACTTKASTWDQDIDTLDELAENIERETGRAIAPENIRNTGLDELYARGDSCRDGIEGSPPRGSP